MPKQANFNLSFGLGKVHSRAKGESCLSSEMTLLRLGASSSRDVFLNVVMSMVTSSKVNEIKALQT
jgi:hypothetical protein